MTMTCGWCGDNCGPIGVCECPATIEIARLKAAAGDLVHEIEVTSNYISPDLQEKLNVMSQLVWPNTGRGSTSASPAPPGKREP